MGTAVIIPAAGQGTRMKHRKNKQFLIFGDRPLLAHTLEIFTREPSIQEILLLGNGRDLEEYRALVQEYFHPQQISLLTGGEERWESVWIGLQNLSRVDRVLIHDGARPLLPLSLLQAILAQVRERDAVIPGLTILDTVKTVFQDQVTGTLKREGLRTVQTPQAFRFSLIYQAYEEGISHGFQGTDDASYVERMGYPVTVIPGSWENIKITTPEDLFYGEMILRERQRRREEVCGSD